MAELTVRRALDTDFPFCWKLYSESLGTTTALAQRIADDVSLEERRFRSIFHPEHCKIIELDGVPAGWYCAVEALENVVIEQFHLERSDKEEKIAEIILESIHQNSISIGKSTASEPISGSRTEGHLLKAGFVPQLRPEVVTLQKQK